MSYIYFLREALGFFESIILCELSWRQTRYVKNTSFLGMQENKIILIVLLSETLTSNDRIRHWQLLHKKLVLQWSYSFPVAKFCKISVKKLEFLGNEKINTRKIMRKNLGYAIMSWIKVNKQINKKTNEKRITNSGNLHIPSNHALSLPLYLDQTGKSWRYSSIFFNVTEFAILRNLVTTTSAMSATRCFFFTVHLNQKDKWI